MREKWYYVPLAAFGCGLVCAGILITACENDDDDLSNAQFYVQPAQVTLTVPQQSVVFQAVGGHAPFTWSVSDTNLGAVSGSGPVVTYISTTSLGANTVQVTDSRAWSASAIVVRTDGTNPVASVISP